MLRDMEYRNENITIIENKYADQSFELMKNLPKDVREAIVKHLIMPAQGGKNAPTDESKKDSSAKSVGEFRLWKFSKCMK